MVLINAILLYQFAESGLLKTEMALSAVIQKQQHSGPVTLSASPGNTLVKNVYQMPVSAISTNGYGNGLTNGNSNGALQQSYISVATSQPGVSLINHGLQGQVIQGVCVCVLFGHSYSFNFFETSYRHLLMHNIIDSVNTHSLRCVFERVWFIIVGASLGQLHMQDSAQTPSIVHLTPVHGGGGVLQTGLVRWVRVGGV